MKLSPLLADYLFREKELKLQGIGKFTMEQSGIVEEDNGKHGKKIRMGTIRFEQDTNLKEDPSLIEFISQNTGKMKSLVSADLSSHIELIKEFLNIGKPFLFESIGTLSKTKSGSYDFVQQPVIHEKNSGQPHHKIDQPSTSEESFTEYEEMLSPKKQVTPSSKKIMLAVVIFAGIGLAIWGGYLVYSGTTKKKDQSNAAAETKNITVKVHETVPPVSDQNITREDLPANTGLTDYKYIVEESERYRALARYAYLTKWGINVKMSTNDSLNFKLYFIVPSLASDTTRIRDSLSLLYTTRGNARVEK